MAAGLDGLLLFCSAAENPGAAQHRRHLLIDGLHLLQQVPRMRTRPTHTIISNILAHPSQKKRTLTKNQKESKMNPERYVHSVTIWDHPVKSRGFARFEAGGARSAGGGWYL